MRLFILCMFLISIPFSIQAQQPSSGPSIKAGEAPAITQGQEVDWIVSTAKELRAAASEKRWGLFVSIVLMAFLAGLNTLLIRSTTSREKLKAYMGEIAVGMALLGYIAVAVASLPVGAHIGDWWAVMWPALKTGFAAIGAYEFIVKRVLQFWAPKLWDLMFKKSPSEETTKP